jgi:hypothetical protein
MCTTMVACGNMDNDEVKVYICDKVVYPVGIETVRASQGL